MRTSDKKPKSEARRAAQTSPSPPLHLSPTAWAWARTWRPGEVGILSRSPTHHLSPSSTIHYHHPHLTLPSVHPSSAQGVWSTAKGWLLRSETSPACRPPVAALWATLPDHIQNIFPYSPPNPSPHTQSVAPCDNPRDIPQPDTGDRGRLSGIWGMKTKPLVGGQGIFCSFSKAAFFEYALCVGLHSFRF